MVTTDKDFANKHYGPLIATCIGSFVVIMAFAFWQARPLYHWVKSQRAISQIDQIYELLESDKLTEAAGLSAEIYQLGPREPEVLRACSRVAFAMKNPEARFFLDKLVEMGEATFEDRRNLFATNLYLGDTERAIALSDNLLKESPDDLELLHLVVDLRLQLEKPRSAVGVLAQIIKLDPEDLEHKLLYARLLIMHGTSKDRGIGWNYIWNLANNTGEIGLAALDTLLVAEGLVPDTQEKLLTLISRHPLIEERHHVASFRLRTALEPENRQTIIDSAMAERRDWKASEQVLFYRWLSEEKEHAFIADNLTFDFAVEDQGLMIVYLNALGHVEGWEKVREHLSNPSLPLSEARQLVFVALCASKLGEDQTVIEESLQKSLRTATRHGSFQEAINTAKFAEAIGLPDLAEMAYVMAQRVPGHADIAYEGLMRIAETQNDTVKIRNIAAQMHYRQPRNSDALERFLYLNALTGFEIESTLFKSLSLIEAEPYRVGPRVIAGLAYLRMKDIPKAFNTTEPCDPTKMTDSQKVVCAAIAAAASQPQIAAQLSAKITPKDLLTEEARLIPATKSL